MSAGSVSPQIFTRMSVRRHGGTLARLVEQGQHSSLPLCFSPLRRRTSALQALHLALLPGGGGAFAGSRIHSQMKPMTSPARSPPKMTTKSGTS